ncbi:MAG: hypothetical protein IPP74_15320 [Alphaproteobacteria bacterium]|nr:hypothetical protein [Alphaproteobacteria bacterium]
MSAFGWIPKDEVVEAIERLAEEEALLGRSPREIVESIMDATTCGINQALLKLKDQKVDSK